MRKMSKRNLADPNIIAMLDLETVPPVTTTRWVARRKGQVVAAVQAGLLTIDEACQLYRLSLEEFTDWQRKVRQAGIHGLQATRGGEFRRLMSMH